MTDLSKYKAFPEGYVIPKGTEVIVISENRDSDSESYRKPGLKGIATETDDWPHCDWEDGMKNIYMCSEELAPLNPQDHPDYKQEEPEWQPKTGEVVLAGNDKRKRIYAFSDEKGHWCLADGYEENFNSKSSAFFVHWETISKYEPTPLKLTRAEIAEKFGTDNFEIID
jgi:hypothetical protein